jgi:hypothetical protein
MAARQKQLLAEVNQARQDIEEKSAEIAKIQAAMEVLREYVPLGLLPGIDENIAAVYGNLKGMTVPDGIATILRMRREPATARELMEILVQAGKVRGPTQNAHIGILGALKRNPQRFRRVGSTWTLVQSNGHLPGLEVGERVPAKKGAKA